MNATGGGPSVETLNAPQGFPLSRRGASSGTLGRWLALVFALIALALSMSAGMSALGSVPVAGATPGADGLVAEVVPGSPAWRSGVRVGDRVVSIEPGPSAESWTMVTEHATVRTASMVAALRETIPLAIAVAALAALAVLAIPVGPRFAAGAAAIAVALSARPLLATGDVAWSTTAGVAALVIPGLWFAAYGPRRRSWGQLIAGAAILVAGAWSWARFVDSSSFETADGLRVLVTSGLAVGIAAVVLGGLVLARQGAYDVRRLADVTFLALVVGILAVSIFAAVPPGLVLLVVVPLLLVYPLARGRVHGALERLVLSDLRSRAAIEAVERERARLAREIHDEPLQRLAAVAQRLDGSDLAAEAAVVRAVSSQLREIAVQLHPPVLVDLGLIAALEDLVGRLEQESAIPIAINLDAASPTGSVVHLSADVELAAYRVAQEAIGNAVRHSGAAGIEVHVRLRPEALVLVVRDDGVGIDAVATREAVARGHLGLGSMAERAELVGASLRVEPARPGTRVTLRWPA